MFDFLLVNLSKQGIKCVADVDEFPLEPLRRQHVAPTENNDMGQQIP